MSAYISGVCNIGPQEITRRRKVGWIGLGIAGMLLISLLLLHSNPLWRLLIFFPAAFSASGFLQAYFHFCAGFARKGVFNFGTIGNIEEVTDESAKVKDKQKGNKIALLAAGIGGIISLICVFL